MKTRSLGSHPGRTADPSASPDFLVDLVGVDGLHAVFSYGKPHTRLCPVQRGRKSRFARDDKFKFDTFVGLRDTDGKTPFDRSSTAHSAVPIALVNGSAPLPLVIPSEPGFPATLHWTQPRVRFSVGENRMKSVNANKINQEIRGSRGICSAPRMAPQASGSHTPSLAPANGACRRKCLSRDNSPNAARREPPATLSRTAT